MKSQFFHPKMYAAVFAIVGITIAVGCAKERPPKTNDDCMSANGYAYYATSGGNCSYSAALAISSTASHWTFGGWYGYSVQFIRDGSNTGGSGRMKHNWTGAPVSNFQWHMDDLDNSIIFCHDYDTAYAPADRLSQITQITPNIPNHPSAVECNFTDGNGTGWDQMALVSGGL